MMIEGHAQSLGCIIVAYNVKEFTRATKLKKES